ncbi:MAG TPA: Maf family protein [Novosphingobium sp.]|nr:Maf family protein [Novosphingobium sp.]
MLVLASQSASRQAMLEAAGVAFTAQPAAVDERAIEATLGTMSPGEVVLALAEAKALAVSAQNPGALVLGSDSLVEVAGRRFDKPRSIEDAADHLRYFSGQIIQLHSAAALARDGATLWRHADCAELQVRVLSEGFIASYLAAEWPEVGGCVGVFRIEGLGVQLFEYIAGSQFTVLGMPLLPVLGALRELGELPT